MGFFRNLFSARRLVTRAMEAQEARLEKLSALPDDAFAAQPDDVLCEVLSYRNDQAANAQFGPPHKRRQSLAECYSAFSGARRVYALVDLYLLEMDVDGLCEVLTGELRELVWELPGLLREVGADAHAALLEAFFTDNGIDPREMSSFRIGRDLETDYAAQTVRYPYPAFNQAFAVLPPLASSLARYAREHLSEL